MFSDCFVINLKRFVARRDSETQLFEQVELLVTFSVG